MSWGGQTLCRVYNQSDCVVAQLCRVVCGHQEVMPWPGLITSSIQTFQGATHLGRRRGGVSAIPEPGKCTREMPSRSP